MNFEQNLKNSGLKITPQRITILQEIEKVGHATVEEIYERILQIYPSISLATIYKNLISMCEAGIINEIKPPLQKQRYEINHTPHSHLICQICGSLQDVEINTAKMIELKEIPNDFQINAMSVSIYGICKKCKENL
ncbi:transcriptional repressor [Helicobacter cholecystus]|uniref:Transcriptional repressor n=1 Tax=Helicobacter cholecystus TaxID=45498 RepID=A0A3D8IVI7_9HELI|nr:transcriptional repressor [Helicobacter cholecystus]RDU69033.1 transcriptional repressor [Helicobacter cholecystus]VEJ24562.1 transcriptional regulator [Helicobacter cholecystus]